jgi:hypothetical protein
MGSIQTARLNVTARRRTETAGTSRRIERCPPVADGSKARVALSLPQSAANHREQRAKALAHFGRGREPHLADSVQKTPVDQC